MKTPKNVILLAVCALTLCLAALASQPSPTTGTVLCQWGPSSDPSVTNYTVWYGTASGTYAFQANAGTNLSFTVTNLTRGVTWYFCSTASNPTATSAFSGEAMAIIGSVPGAPTSFKLTIQ